MKRRRRVEIRVERHELSIYAGSSSVTAHASDLSGEPSRGAAIEPHLVPGRFRHARPESCPICGSDDLIPLTDAIARTGGGSTLLKDGLEAGIYHLHCSNSGEWWVCGQSLTSD